MPSYVQRPATIISDPGAVVSPSGATALARLNDNSDATFVDRLTGPMSWTFSYAAPTIPTTQYVARVSGSVRYRGGSSAFFIQNLPYRNGDSGLFSPSIFTGAANFTTSEIGRRIADWLRSSVTNLRSIFADNGTTVGVTGQTTVDYADVWITIYTVIVSTATPSAATMTVTNTPTIPVAVVSTVDWEGSEPSSSALRKVTVFVRVEANSSTGAGTTAALLETTVDITLTATGTTNLSITMPGSLPNGTYKAYARARRYSEAATPANESEMFSAWSAAATLTMNVTPMGVPTISATADNTLDRSTLSVTVPTTSPYTTATVTVQRSADAGTTWENVRGAVDAPIAFATPTTFYDYEAPLDVALLYRASALGFVSGVPTSTSAWSSNASVTLAAPDGWNLKVPLQPSLNIIGVNVIGNPSEQIDEDLGIFRPIDRRYPVIVAGELTGWDGDLTIETIDEADWLKVRTIIEAQALLLLQSPFGWQKYIRLIGGGKTSIMGTPTQPRRRVTVNYIETGTP